MNYELLKELKDAGFPNMQEWTEHDYKTVGKDYVCSFCDDTIHGAAVSTTMVFTNDYTLGCLKAPPKYSIPSLSKLIEACGEWFGYLQKVGPGWRTYVNASFLKPFYEETKGTTPEEAVANLWLSLNKKD